jgi:hypothetical protein
VLGVQTDGLDLAVERTNVSLGLAEAELLRRVNVVLDDDLSWPDYGPTVKFWFAEQVLAELTSGPRAAVPGSMHRWLEQQATQMTTALAESGWNVVGDLSDLHPVVTDETGAGQALDPPPAPSAAGHEPTGPSSASVVRTDEPVDSADSLDLRDLDESDELDESDDDAPSDAQLEPTDAEVLAVATQALGVLLRERARMLGKRGAGPRPPQTLPHRVVSGAARARQLLRRRWVAMRTRDQSPGM